MQSENYKASIIDTIKQLATIRSNLFDSIVEIGMQGELKEWNDSVPVGEEHFLSKELFEACVDINIQLVLSLRNKVEETLESIMNLNGFTIEGEDTDLLF